MTTDELRKLIERGTTLFARRPKQGDTELELIVAEKAEKGYLIGAPAPAPSSPLERRRTRWPVAIITTVEAATETIEAWALEHRRARFTRRESERLQRELSEALAKLELSPEQAEQLAAPCSDRVVHVSLSLLELRKVVAVMNAAVEASKE